MGGITYIKGKPNVHHCLLFEKNTRLLVDNSGSHHPDKFNIVAPKTSCQFFKGAENYFLKYQVSRGEESGVWSGEQGNLKLSE